MVETGRDVPLMTDRGGHVIGLEKLRLSMTSLDSVLLKTTDRVTRGAILIVPLIAA